MPAGITKEKTPYEMIEILPETELPKAQRFVDLAEQLDCKTQIRFAPAHKTWKCTVSRKNPSRVLFTIECTSEKWHVKACLWNIDAYRQTLEDSAEAIQNTVKNAYDCNLCNARCKGAAFAFDGISYRKCVGNCFYFSNLTDPEWEQLVTLIRREHEASNRVKSIK